MAIETIIDSSFCDQWSRPVSQCQLFTEMDPGDHHSGVGWKDSKEVVMRSGPSCPLRLGTFDSPDYWTDTALMSAVRPLTAEESHRMTKRSQSSVEESRRRSSD